MYCPTSASKVFLAAFAQNKYHSTDEVKPVNMLFCAPTYYQQNVTATIRRSDRGIRNYTIAGSKQSLPQYVFDPRRLEWQMNSATQQQAVRGDIPASTWADQTERLSNLPLSMSGNGAVIPMMAGLAVGAYQRPLEDYLDPDTLRLSYQAAYRLLFARAMVDVLQPADFTNPKVENGTRSPQGLALPAKNRFLRQMLENYLPTIIATLIEPVWVILNRLLCVLQPFEELRNDDTSSGRSFGLNYASLPPQLVVFKAAATGHFTLSAVCLMALLANILAIAFGAMFNERSVLLPVSADFSHTWEAKFAEIDATLGPWGTNSDWDPFYIAMSNLTSASPMPAWTHDEGFYLPFDTTGSSRTNNSTLIEASTMAFGVNLTYQPLRAGSGDNSWKLVIGPNIYSGGAAANLSLSFNDLSLGTLNCSAQSTTIATQSSSGEFGYCPKGREATEIMSSMIATVPGQSAMQSVCKQLIVGAWIRSPTVANCTSGDGTGDVSGAIGLTDEDATVIACLPTLYAALTKVTVDQDSIVQSLANSEYDQRTIVL
ncbi:hypothetical protein LTR08_007337 [Meristemomyces frigidus]|nr:hypothetical protein LTR08_007337 [Meristemomyces frigidus]